MAFDCLTDEAIESWGQGGKQAVLAAARGADEETVSVIFQELVRSGLDKRIDPGEAGEMVRRIIGDKQQHEVDMDAQALFLDVIALLSETESTKAEYLTLLSATDIDPQEMRIVLEDRPLQNSALVQASFRAQRIRKITTLLYRQANYNLLREESEGYAKLLTEYFNIVDTFQGNQAIESGVVDDAFQRIKALIGAFDLDVGRALDVTMDIGANTLVRAYVFIIKFYRASSWWPDNRLAEGITFEEPAVTSFPAWALPGSTQSAYTEEQRQSLNARKHLRDERFWQQVRDHGVHAFFEIGARKILNFDDIQELLNTEVQPIMEVKKGQEQEVNPEKRVRTNEARRYMRKTKLLPPPGNADAAQLLGFKLRYYASTARSAGETLPDNLIHFTALLIKIGFISLRDLYPHLYPCDEQMPQERKRLEKEKAEKDSKERPGGGPNALAMAAALTDDTQQPTTRLRNEKLANGGATPKAGEKKDDSTADELPTPANQKLLMLKALLILGALPEALFILGRFPWLVDVDSDIPRYLHRVVRRMLSKMTEELLPLQDRSALAQPREIVKDTTADSNGKLPRIPGPQRRSPMKWLNIEGVSAEGIEGRYYYQDWDDCIPVCQSIEHVVLLCNTLLGYLGPKIGQDHVVYGTLLRVARSSLAKDDTETNRTRWLDLMKRLLVPASSFTKHNPALTDDLYQLLLLWPTTTRYRIYAEWFTGKTSRLPDVKTAFDYNRAEAKEVMRRVSNDNVKTQSRALGKVSYSAPGVLITYMINQMESYTNMIPALVECTKYFPKLAYDVLTWCLINSLSGGGRDRMQADGMLTSSWLQALSSFVASLFYRYSDVNPSPVLQYLAAELRKGESTDLEMFEQVLTEMAGIRPDTEYNDQQILSMSGGEVLQAQVIQSLGDTRHARKSSAKRLIKALSEPGLIGQLLISIAQENQAYAHHPSSANMPLKVLENNLDKIHRVFWQYLQVLKANLRLAEFEAAVPDVTSLIGDFALRPAVAFTVCRAIISDRVNQFDEAKKQEGQERKKQRLGANIKEIEMQYAEDKPEIKDEQAVDDSDETKGAQTNGESQETPAPAIPSLGNPLWHPVLQPIIDRLPEVAGDLKDRISIPFYVTFWTLDHSDVLVHTESYITEKDRLDKQISAIIRDRSNMAAAQVQERDRKRKALAETMRKLQDEVKARVVHFTGVTNRLKREKTYWFDRSRDREHLDARHEALLQECFLPRAVMSPTDAHYSFLMLKILHERGTPGFSTLHLMNAFFKKQALSALIFQFTEDEAQNFGRFLNEVLKLLGTWHAKKENYQKDVVGEFRKDNKLPGFTIKATDYNDPSTWSFLDYESFRRMLYNWHGAVYNALVACFDTGEYSHTRNGIKVLKAIVHNFPQLNFHGKNMVGAIQKIVEREKSGRRDLETMARSVLAPLMQREKLWVLPQAFRLNDVTKDGKPGSRQPSAKPETPQPANGTPKLNAAAPEFKPTGASGGMRKESAVEDGEVQEEKKTAKAVEAADIEMKDAPISKDESSANLPERSAVVVPKQVPTAPAKDQKKSDTRVELTATAPAPSAPRAPQPSVNGDGLHDPSRAPSAQSTPSRKAREPSMRTERVQPRPASHAEKPLPPVPAAAPRQDNRYGPREGSRRAEEFGRLDRPGDVRPPPPRDHSPGSRGSRVRSPPRAALGLPRDERPRPRDDSYPVIRRDVSMGSARPTDSRDRVNGSMGPPSAQPHPDRAAYLPSAALQSASQATARPSSSGGSSALSQASASFGVNPERQRLIDAVNAPGSSSMADKDRRRERDSRDGRDDRNAPPLSRSDSRQNGRVLPDIPRDGSRHEQPMELAPSGPRNGRLNKDQSGESSYGRLDAPQDMPSVSGARPPNGPSGGRGGRNFTAPQPIIHGRNELSAISRAPEPLPPFRPPHGNDRRGSGPHNDRQGPGSAPQTPIAESPAGIHPSRLQNVVQQQPPPLQTTHQNMNGMRGASSPLSGAPPSGPRVAGNRAPAGAPTGPSPITAPPPSGPAAGPADRQRGSRQRGQMSQINAQLQQANSPSAAPRGPGDVSFRGASTRQNSFAASPSGMGPGVPVVASPMDPPLPRRGGGEGQGSRPPSRAEGRSELFGTRDGGEGREDSRHRRREGDRSSDRQHSGRHASHERRRDDEQIPQRLPQPVMDDGRDKHGPLRDERRVRDDRDRHETPRDARVPERGPRDEGRRMPEGPGSFPGRL
ncbi:THO complex subunit 2 N-terminus [Teratosphaeria destructans]|uniref:THO complex subunit 2 n=1 Tax=Teratosphaeria destructans TaxID=418781 RepID=A0A9W7STL7_9PEZI|nr:THO complex subunit 2 N-terminus [Teratosphaeria destructans]